MSDQRGILYKRGEPVTEQYDIVVIGSGLSGMTAAKVLSQGNHKVLLLEAHNKLGGFATWFFRDQRQFIFDVSLHGFPVGMKKTCRKYWGEVISKKIIPIKKIKLINPQFELETDYTKTDFIKILEEKFKISKTTIEEFFQYLKSMNFYDHNDLTIRDLFNQFFPNRNDVWRLLLEPITYANGSTLDDPALAYGIVFSNFMDQGVYTFEGGTDEIITLMKEELLKAGVDIKLQTKVVKIKTTKESNDTVAQVHSVCYQNENLGMQKQKANDVEDDSIVEIKCKAVVSNANLHKTIFDFIDHKHLSSDFLEKAKKVRMNTSSCQVYLGIDASYQVSDIGELIFTSTCPNYDDDAILTSFPMTSRTFSIYHPRSRTAEPLCSTTIVASANARYHDWKNLSDRDYEEKKEEMIQQAIEELEKLFPQITSHIIFKEAATPLTVEKFTHHHQGASFGTKFEGLSVSKDLTSEVAGLYHSGSVGIIMSGWLGAANYGVIQANALESYLAKESTILQ